MKVYLVTPNAIDANGSAIVIAESKEQALQLANKDELKENWIGLVVKEYDGESLVVSNTINIKHEPQTEIEKAIQYVRDNKTWSDAEDDVALQYMGEQGCGLQFAFEKIYNQIYDLMEEYSADNDLPEGWWLYEKDVDEIFLDLK